MNNCIRCHKPIDDTPFCPLCGAKQERRSKHTKSRGNGQGTAYKRGKTWTLRVIIGWTTEAGSEKRSPVCRYKGGFKTKNEALAYVPTLMAAKDTPKAPQLQQYWELYSSGEMEKLSNDKRTAYKIAWNKIKDIHFIPVDKLTVADLRTVAYKNATTYYPMRDIKTVLKHLFALAAADGFASKDLPSFIELPTLEETERQPFTDLEQAAIWKQYEQGNADAAIPLIMIYTGMMTGEMQKLTAEMVDLESKQIVGVGLKTKVRKKAAVILPDCILPMLSDLCANHTGRLFPFGQDEFYSRYYAVLEKAGCRKLTPYSCRHTTATALAITEGIAPQTIKKIMRWSTTRMLDRYAHPDDLAVRAAANSLKRKSTVDALLTFDENSL